jgi:hypothetical protein
MLIMEGSIVSINIDSQEKKTIYEALDRFFDTEYPFESGGRSKQ